VVGKSEKLLSENMNNYIVKIQATQAMLVTGILKVPQSGTAFTKTRLIICNNIDTRRRGAVG
jgi:hypothetical protein